MPRTWKAAGTAPWNCVGRATLVFSVALVLVVGQDLRQLEPTWLVRLGDVQRAQPCAFPCCRCCNWQTPFWTRLNVQTSPRQRWLVRQSLSLLLLEGLILVGGIGLIQSISWAAGRISSSGRAVGSGRWTSAGQLALSQICAAPARSSPLPSSSGHGSQQAAGAQRLEGAGTWVTCCLNLLLGATLGLLLGLPFSALLLMASCHLKRRGARLTVAHIDG